MYRMCVLRAHAPLPNARSSSLRMCSRFSATLVVTMLLARAQARRVVARVAAARLAHGSSSKRLMSKRGSVPGTAYPLQLSGGFSVEASEAQNAPRVRLYCHTTWTVACCTWSGVPSHRDKTYSPCWPWAGIQHQCTKRTGATFPPSPCAAVVVPSWLVMSVSLIPARPPCAREL